MRLPDGVRRLFRIGSVSSRVEREIDEEIEHHFDAAVRGHVRRGLDEEEARRRARAEFGDEKAYRRTLKTIDHGRVRMRERREWSDGLARTFASAWRSVRRSPAFTVSVVSILALGIGANAVMYGVVDRLLLSPPQHVQDADDVRLLHVRRIGFNGDVFTGSTITYPDVRDFEGVGAFASVAGYTEPRGMTVGRGEHATRARVAAAGAELFPLLGVEPFRGRFFQADEDRRGASPTAVLAQEYWEREMGSDPDAIGRVLDVGQGSYTVVGIAPPGFTGATLEPVDIWLPLLVSQHIESGDAWMESRVWYWLHSVARLAPSASVEAAEAEATGAHRAGRAEMIAEGDYDPGAEVLVAPVIAARGPSASAESQVARWLAGVSLVVLLVACFNVANLLLARAVRRRRETAVRLTLGVGRGRLLLDTVVESLVLAGLGAVTAVLVARFMGDAVHQALLPDVAFTDTGIGPRLVFFTAAATVVVGLVTGFIPALQSLRTELGECLRSAGRTVSAGGSRTRVALLVAQAALSVVLLVGAGLFVRSLHRAQSLDLGFDAERLAVVSLEWNETLPTDERTRVYRSVQERVRRLPEVRAAALSYTVPFRSSVSLGQPRVPGLDSIPRHHNGGPYVNKVGADYFEVMGLTVVEGRGIETADDGEGAPPVAVVSQSMARAIWPDGSALGRCMILGDEGEAPCTEVVGVVENHRRQELVEDDPHFLYYVNQSHPEFRGPPQALMVQVAGTDPRSSLDGIRDEARSTSGLIRFVNADVMSDFIAPQMRSWKLGASMFSVFGLLALVVAAWGLYSTLAFDVALRTHELGIRSALGADRSRIVGMILRRALWLVGIGTVVGLLVAAAAADFIQPVLFRVSGRDPAIYSAVLATLMVVAAVAGSVPAWRATRVDAREALQAD